MDLHNREIQSLLMFLLAQVLSIIRVYPAVIFPDATYPFGMVQLSPDTKENPEDPCSGYDYKDNTIVGFSHTHLNGTGVADLFDFLFMPYQGDLKWFPGNDSVKGYSSTFKHSNEKGSPGYYSVLLDNGILSEFTVTAHSGMHKYSFPEDKPYNLNS